MNKITLQNLTPDVYYNMSRDFQFIGRLYDVVLNSVKSNSECLYNLPLNKDTDERLIDLMTLTLGFKSRHNYNIKQLTSLCTAFCYILKNKGNITSIITAAQALINAEGISESVTYELKEDNTVLVLFVPQTLTDLNLLKDLFNYVLPAGMSCELVREFKVAEQIKNTVGTSDTILRYDNDATNIREKSIIAKASQADLTDALAKNTAGLIANTDVIKP